MMVIRTLLAATLALFAAAGPVYAAGKAKAPKHHDWSFTGPFGTYDDDALQRGFQVYETVCANCHGVRLLSFRHLGQKGGPFYLDACPAGYPDSLDCANPNDNPVVKAIAANYRFPVLDGPDEAGEMFERAGLASDGIPGPYPNDQVARLANNNAIPPDLSLITKARHHGIDYLYSLLVGYEEPPETVEIAPGQYYNPYFKGDMAQNLKPQYRNEDGTPADGVEVPKGGVLAMAPPLTDGIVDYEGDVPETVEQYAEDVTHFLAWAAEPKMEQRKALGLVSVLYLIILAGILYWSYRKVWSNVSH